MSAMVISSVKRFIDMSPKLEEIGIKNIHFYNSKGNEELTTPMVALVPFIDVVVLGKDAYRSTLTDRVVEEALARHIPVVSEDCIADLSGRLY
ncbi:hypothetical protein [Dissulfurispira sp.]|uniref:hypothetical protein n=1 Tax=Dissulfurispira sp. TaxID=2817609 RepID=UPI002FDACF89